MSVCETIQLINFNIGGVGTTALQDFSEKWEVKREKTLSDKFLSFIFPILLYTPRPLWEADCELRANRLAEVQDCADPLNANNQAG